LIVLARNPAFKDAGSGPIEKEGEVQAFIPSGRSQRKVLMRQIGCVCGGANFDKRWSA